MPLDTLAAVTPAEIAFLEGSRALYYEEMSMLIATGIAKLLPGGDANG